MAYLALYRRFRPSGFDGLVGQEHIVKTLVNQIAMGRIGHAYLFCGARGTGKTSAAKIFARAINCEHPVNGSPCGKCPSCVALSDSSNLDVLEMDAASNNKVENVREIREKIQYPPVNGKYKVYIIDEVHMLTTEAFNALLKTLEEPPEHAVFILATTEVHKLPSTILSRCMRFDFRLIPTRKIADLIAKIYDEIGKEYDDEAVVAIARAGNGSIRDALSVADVCVSYSDGKLTYSDVLDVLGATDTHKITKLLEDIFKSDTGEMLEAVEELCDSGKSVGVLCRDIITRMREIIVAKTCRTGKSILELPDEMYDELKRIGDETDNSRMLRALEIFSEAEGSLRYSATPRIVLETACIKAARPEADRNIDALNSRITALETAIKNGEFTVKTTLVSPKTATSSAPLDEPYKKPEKAVSKEQNADDDYIGDMSVPEPPAEDNGFIPPIDEGSPDLNTVKAEPQYAASANMSAAKIWGTVVRKLRANGNIMLWVACREMSAELFGRKLKVIAPDESSYGAVTKPDNLTPLINTVKSVGDYDVEIVRQNEEEKIDFFDRDVREVENTFGKVAKIKE
ncbi:MAG: DNA polymerase III subunit gamma/tau [Clostridia bacterium]|nr:DNA polymerase III subunit gamma/tau [Clostridia bacterium]